MNTYLKHFDFLGEDLENSFFTQQRMTCFNNFYPFQTLKKDFTCIDFEPVTILYGGNGSGKSTVLNIIADALEIPRNVRYNRSSFMEIYVELCGFHMSETPEISKILTSDDVFKSLFTLRERNQLIDEKRREEMRRREYYRQSGMSARNLVNGGFIEHYDELKNICDARSKTASAYLKSRVEENLIGKSNGETALDFFAKEVSQPGLFLLDEPENSLSVAFQAELADYLFDSARFFGAQLVIATHSPFILSIPNAKIYNLDTDPVSTTKDWTTLENMKNYYGFFKRFSDKFEKN